MKRGRLIIFIVIFLFSFFCNPILAVNEKKEELTLYARSAVLMDASLGRVLYGKEETKRLPMASTTKIMTCIIALEYGNEEKVCNVSTYAANQPKVRLGVQCKERFFLKDLLYALMLESDNDVAVVIAENVAGNVEGFAELMNQKARNIGCTSTHFVTPNGLDDSLHYTTAYDLAKIMRYCVYESPERESFLTVTRTLSYSFSNYEHTRQFSCSNHNQLLTSMEGAVSGKTGFTGSAGYCYVGVVERNGKAFVVALLACGWPGNKGYKWKDTRTLIEYGDENYENVPVSSLETSLIIPVENGLNEEEDYSKEAWVRVTWKACEKNMVLLAKGEKLIRTISLPDHLDAPINKGQVCGNVVYSIDDYIVQDEDIIAEKEISKVEITEVIKSMFKEWCCRKKEY